MEIVNALTIDVEDYFHVQAFKGVVARESWESYPRRVEQNTQRLLEMLLAHDVRATFFVLGWVAEKCPELIKSIHDRGHRVGCHSYAHGAIYERDQDYFRDDLRRAKSIIEDLIGASVRSYRAPSFSITDESLWALEILAEEGIEFDSSIFPIHHDNYGIADAPRFPYLERLRSGGLIKEFPPSTIRMFGNNIPCGGGGYLRLYPYAVTAWALRRINNMERRPAMVYLHPWELDPAQPRLAASIASRFRHYQNLETTEWKCVRLLKEFAWAPMEDVFDKTLES